MIALTAQQSREVARRIRTLTPKQRADFYYFVSIEGKDPYEFLSSIEVIKHASHDQSSHGSWAGGGNKLSHREIYNLQVGRSDPLVRKVYAAEEKYQPQIQRELEKPFAPSRTEYQTKEEYDKAYKEYSKKWTEWSRETSRNIKSKTGEKHLDGSKKGVQNYVNDVTSQDWFVSEFGNGGVVGTPQVALRDNRSAGAYTLGFRNGQPVSSMVINNGYSKNEPTIIHEIAHYATAISQTTPFDAHGVEFARNHVFIAANLISPEYANGLTEAYIAEGVNLGN